MIGAIGSKNLDDVIIFEVSDKKVITPLDFSRSNKVRFGKNDVLQKKPISEYIGPDLDTISFKLDLKVELGINPRAEIDKLMYLQREGTIISVIIGSKGFGVYRWRIVDVNTSFDRVDNKGNCLSATCDITLEEYV